MKESEAKNNLFGIGVANAFAQIVTVISQLISVPLFLSGWGVDRYAAWIALSTIPAFLSLSDLGISATAGNRAELLLHTEGAEAAHRTLRSSFLWLCLASGGFCGGLGTLAIALPTGYLSACGLPGDFAARWAFAALCGATFFSLISAFQTNQFRLIARLPEAIWIGNVFRLVEGLAVPFSVGLLRIDLLTACLSILGIRGAQFLANNVRLARLRQPILRPALDPQGESAASVLVPAAWRMAFPLGQALQQQVVTLLIARYLPAAALVQFSIYRSLARFPLQLGAFLQSTVWVEFTRLHARSDYPRIRQLHVLCMQSALFPTILYSVVLLVGGGTIVDLLSKGQVQVSGSLNLWFSLIALPYMVWSISSIPLTAVNNNATVGLPFVLTRLLLLGAIVAFAQHGGLQVVPIATLVADAVLMSYVVLKACEITRDSSRNFVVSIWDFRGYSKAVTAFGLAPAWFKSHL